MSHIGSSMLDGIEKKQRRVMILSLLRHGPGTDMRSGKLTSTLGWNAAFQLAHFIPCSTGWGNAVDSGPLGEKPDRSGAGITNYSGGRKCRLRTQYMGVLPFRHNRITEVERAERFWIWIGGGSRTAAASESSQPQLQTGNPNPNRPVA